MKAKARTPPAWYAAGPADAGVKGYSKGAPIPSHGLPKGKDKGDSVKGKGDVSKGKDKGDSVKGKGDSSKGDFSKGKEPPPHTTAAASSWQVWSPECWTCGSPDHVQADCPAVRASRPFPIPPLESCLGCGTPGHSRRQCPILIKGAGGSSAILPCILHNQLRSVHSLIWSPTARGWRCALYCPCD